ncbi:hypothetical protein D2E64_18195 [Mycobacteroides abscessus]|uniref:hypothetical protein n=1 Tax=Mycobacteroides abscessus TaxID=36809 RepID=UPI000D3EB2BF|nr:hypothetical protein [Mycobacteroides abscessus]MBN7567139.1 hypothetical protein [Mycobacteroides abscessus subsp. massiliense]PVA72263.1 hypothetical protein DDJ76_22950 [Mycobacteroides abscessus]RIS03935.1 hypothetical protein D2E63_22570 [Mycobacteroides abscessus]RIS11308.1 hypothetical protein D2E69_22240 [Mycobacteroides abscessus]RIS23587.1 hypothetical protein D2E67_22215 [Mycobacteroides abscessus]
MKTLKVEWTERKRATVNVPDTYDPDPHRDELLYMVGQIDSEAVIDLGAEDLSYRVTAYDPAAEVLVSVDPDTALYTAAFVHTAHADDQALREWSSPAPRHTILSEAVAYLNAQGDLLQDDGAAQSNDLFPVIRPGQRSYVAFLRLTLAD